MPWHQEPMKDVVTCDKPRGVGKRAVILGCPNGRSSMIIAAALIEGVAFLAVIVSILAIVM